MVQKESETETWRPQSFRSVVIKMRRSSSGKTRDNDRRNKILFTTPEGRIRTSNCIINDAYAYDIEYFCREIVGAARDWFRTSRENVNVLSNLPHLLRMRPDGYAPYIVGQPVIAGRGKMAKKPDEKYTDEQAESIATNALRRALATPYKPQKKLVGKARRSTAETAKSKKQTPIKR